MRICLLTHYYAPERGAPQVRLKALATEFAARGHSPVVHTGFPNYPSGRIQAPYRNRPVIEERDPAGIPIVRSVVYPAPNAGFLRRVLNHAVFAAGAVATGGRTGDVDVVVAETPPLFTAAAAVFYARRKRVPLVLNVADRWPASAVALGALTDPRAVGAAERLEAWCYRNAAAVVAPTTRLAAALERHPDVRRVVHVPPAVDLGRFAAPTPPQGTGNGRPLRVVYAGTVGMAQRVDVLVEAAALAGPETVQVTIAGDGAEAPAVRQAIAEGAVANVEAVGQRPPEDVPGLYAAADAGAVLLHDAPLFDEALPTKLFEVMAAARPVVLAARGESADMVTAAGCGIVSPPRDAPAYAESLRRLAREPGLAERLGLAGRRHVERHHTRAASADAWEQLLEEVRRDGAPGR